MTTTLLAPRPTLPEAGTTTMKKFVLIVEDEEDIRELVSYHLLKEGYQIASVTSGEEALALVEKQIPDLILLDLMLPELDGFAVCEILRRDARTANIPIIILTAMSGELARVAGMGSGANDFITKPFSPKYLLARIENVLHPV